MTKSDRGTPLTISLQIPTYWTPEQAFAVFELVDELRETIWRCYALQLQQEYRDQRRHHDADYDPIEPTICRSDLQSPSKTQRGLSAPFVAIAPPLRGFTQPLTRARSTCCRGRARSPRKAGWNRRRPSDLRSCPAQSWRSRRYSAAMGRRGVAPMPGTSASTR